MEPSSPMAMPTLPVPLHRPITMPSVHDTPDPTMPEPPQRPPATQSSSFLVERPPKMSVPLHELSVPTVPLPPSDKLAAPPMEESTGLESTGDAGVPALLAMNMFKTRLDSLQYSLGGQSKVARGLAGQLTLLQGQISVLSAELASVANIAPSDEPGNPEGQSSRLVTPQSENATQIDQYDIAPPFPTYKSVPWTAHDLPAERRKEETETGTEYSSFTAPHERGQVRSSRGNKTETRRTSVFCNAEDMKEKLEAEMQEKKLTVTDLYNNGSAATLAKHPIFEVIILAVVALNSLWMAIEIDHDHSTVLYEAEPVFQIMAHFFCTFFVAEIGIRFFAFESKMDAFRNTHFVFDFTLALLTIFDTWIIIVAIALSGVRMHGSNMKLLMVLRIMRLVKILRLARFIRLFPEVMVIIRGIRMAFRSVSVIISLLACIIYIGGIMIRVLLDDTEVGKRRFATLPMAMGTLLLDLTLSGSRGVGVIREADEEHFAYAVVLLAFVLFANVTVMGVLAGSLVQAVRTVAELEREENSLKDMAMKMDVIWESLMEADENNDGSISLDELFGLFSDPLACQAFENMGVDIELLKDVAPFILEQKGGSLELNDFKKMVVDLRKKNMAWVKDHVETRKCVDNLFKEYFHPDVLQGRLFDQSSSFKSILAHILDEQHLRLHSNQGTCQCTACKRDIVEVGFCQTCVARALKPSQPKRAILDGHKKLGGDAGDDPVAEAAGLEDCVT